jgi:hypothetical protein
MVVRRIELQLGGTNPRKGIILNDGTNLTETYIPVATTNGRLVDSCLTCTNDTLYADNLEVDNLTVTSGLTATSIVYQGQELDDRFVNVTGDTMTGDLTINANLTVTGDTSLQTLSAETIFTHTISGMSPVNINNAMSVDTTGTTLLQQLILSSGTTTSAPLKFVSGDLLESPEQGAIEYNDNDYYATVELNTYTSYYPPAQSDTYVKATSTLNSTYSPYMTTDPSSSLIGDYANNQWLAVSSANQRFHIDLGSLILINRIYYENTHKYGAMTNYGAREFTLWATNDGTDFSNLTWVDDATMIANGWVQLTTDVSSFEQHVAADIPDPKYIGVTNYVAYRYFCFKISNTYGGARCSLRRIELQSDGSGGSGNPRKGIILNDGTNLTETYIPVATTNGRLIDSCLTCTNDTLYADNIEVDNLTITSGLTATSITYQGQELDDRFVNVTGDTYCSTIKIHRTTAHTGVTTSTWTDCDNFTLITGETTGLAFSLSGDSKTIEINEDGFYQFGGFLNFIDNVGLGFSGVTILSRLYRNKSIEVDGSQAGQNISLIASGSSILNYNGTVYCEDGDTINLQYYTNESNLEFDSNSAFDNKVAYTLWVIKIGI